MSVLNHLAQAAAVILLIELIVVILIFAGISGGLAFGLRWVRGKTDWAFDKANTYIRMGVQYLHKGTDYAATPVIATSGFAERVRGTAEAIREQVRGIRSQQAVDQPPAVAVRPVPSGEPAEETEAPVPLV